MKLKSITAYVALNLALLIGFVSVVFGSISYVPEARATALWGSIGMGFLAFALLWLAWVWNAKWFKGIGILAFLMACVGISLSGRQLLGW